MRVHSRRQFIKSCFYAALAGIGGALVFRTFRRTDLSDVMKSVKTDPGFEPAYLKLHRSGELKRRGEELWETMRSCRLCPRECGVDRLAGEEGFCRAFEYPEIARRITRGEYAAAVRWARAAGLTNLEIQGYPSS